jgi:hypothetical protein
LVRLVRPSSPTNHRRTRIGSSRQFHKA